MKVEIEISKFHVFVILAGMMVFTAASTVNIRDSMTKIYGSTEIKGDTTIGQTDTLTIEANSQNLSLIPTQTTIRNSGTTLSKTHGKPAT